MINNTANIYVSIGLALRRGSDESHAYRRQKHTFMISVEPHHFHIPGTSHHKTVLTHFEAARDNATGNYRVAKYSSKDSPVIIGNVLIAELARTSVNKVHEVLSQKLASASRALADGELHADNEGEHWIRAFVHALQDREVVNAFKMNEFITWLHGYLADRIDDQAPALVAYPRAHKDHEQKTSKHRFWIPFPTAKNTCTNSRGEPATFGGLM